MLRRFLKWNAERRAWNRDHEVAWAGARELTESGLSRFQILCEPLVLAELKAAGIVVVDREVVGERERYIKARLAGTPWALWIYIDGAEISSAGGTTNRIIELSEATATPTPEAIEASASYACRALARLREELA
jgi:hypothetical protein